MIQVDSRAALVLQAEPYCLLNFAGILSLLKKEWYRRSFLLLLLYMPAEPSRRVLCTLNFVTMTLSTRHPSDYQPPDWDDQSASCQQNCQLCQQICQLCQKNCQQNCQQRCQSGGRKFIQLLSNIQGNIFICSLFNMIIS